MKTLEEQRKEAEENYASRGCDGDCALCPEICHKSSDRMAFHAGWDACIDYLAHLPWDKAIDEIAKQIKSKEE